MTTTTGTWSGSHLERDARVLELLDHKQQLINYLLSKVKAADWHGVADAAMDLRELDAQIKAKASA